MLHKLTKKSITLVSLSRSLGLVQYLCCGHSGVVTDNFNACTSAWLCVYPFTAQKDRFEGVMLATEWTP
jgi:hypothetical protein